MDIEDPAQRFTIEPIRNPRLWDLYKREAQPATWFAEDVSLANDVADFAKLSLGEKHFITMVLAFFAGADNLVAENINVNFMQDVNVLEAKYFYDHQAFMERVHAEVYAKLITTYIPEGAERQRLFQSLASIPVVAKKGQWAARYADPRNASFPERLVAFAVFEGVFFSGSFASIFYMKRKGVLPGLCFSNDYIARDEALHCRFACMLYGHVIDKLPQSKVHDMFREAVQIEAEFMTEALRVSLIGMNADQMLEYIRFVADYWLGELGYAHLFGAKNPFDWMHLISMQSKTNFFEKRVSDYSKPCTAQQTEFGVDEDF